MRRIKSLIHARTPIPRQSIPLDVFSIGNGGAICKLIRPMISREFNLLRPLPLQAFRQPPTITTEAIRGMASSSSSPFASGGGIIGQKATGKKTTRKKAKQFIPRKAAVTLTEQSRTFFRKLLENNRQMDGVILKHQQSSTGEPRMVFSFDFVKKEQLQPGDEGVSLELLDDGSPKPPMESIDDGLPKLFVHRDAFLKVLGATVDVNLETITPILYDREGNIMDPNA